MSKSQRACGGAVGDGSGTPLPEFVPGLCNWGEAGPGVPPRICRMPENHDGDHDLREVQE